MSPSSGLQPTLVGVTIALPCLTFIFVVLRLYSRFYITRTLNREDGLIVMAMILSTALSCVDVLGTYAGFLGYHWADIPWEKYDASASERYQYAMTLLYNPILALVKNAMLLFYLRLEGGTMSILRRVIKATLVFNTALMIAIFMASIFQCVPISKAWSSSEVGHCIDHGMFYSATAGLAILTDLLVVCIPSWMIQGLQMARTKKLYVIAVLSLGFIVTGVSIYRLYFVMVSYYGPPSPDPTYTAGGLATILEINMAIVCACAPTLKPIVKRWFPSRFSNQSTYIGPLGGGSRGLVTVGGSEWMDPTNRATVVAGVPNRDTFELHTNRRSRNHVDDTGSGDDDSEKGLASGRRTRIVKKTTVDIFYSSPSV